MGSSYVLLLTAFYVDNGHQLPLWKRVSGLDILDFADPGRNADYRLGTLATPRGQASRCGEDSGRTVRMRRSADPVREFCVNQGACCGGSGEADVPRANRCILGLWTGV